VAAPEINLWMCFVDKNSLWMSFVDKNSLWMSFVDKNSHWILELENLTQMDLG
jgi:hypothetical protein